MILKVYWGSGSPVSWRVLLGLALKGMDYDSHRLNLGEKEHRSPDYLALNPRGSFPLLVAGDTCIRGSMAILNYLERAQPDPALFGSTAQETGAIWQSIGDHDDHLGPATQTLTRAFFRNNGDRGSDNIDPALEVVARELDLLNQALDSEWLVGTRASAAEVVLYPTIHRLMRAAAVPEAHAMRDIVDATLSQYPRLVSWLERFTCLPGVDATYPPHWRS